MKKYKVSLPDIFHAIDDSNELAQAITGNLWCFCAKMGRWVHLTLELILKWGLMLAKYVLLNKNMFVLITDVKKDDGSIEGNVVLNTGCWY